MHLHTGSEEKVCERPIFKVLRTGTRSMIAVCYGYRIKLYRINVVVVNIIRDMVMQLNFTY